MIEVTKLSSKGQVVIPQGIRASLQLKDGTLFTIAIQDDTICLKKVELPVIKKWKEAIKPFREAAKKSGFTREDLDRIVTEVKIKR